MPDINAMFNLSGDPDDLTDWREVAEDRARQIARLDRLLAAMISGREWHEAVAAETR